MKTETFLYSAHYPFFPQLVQLLQGQDFLFPASKESLDAHLSLLLADCRALDECLAHHEALQSHTLFYFTQSARYLHPSIRCEVRHLAGSLFAHLYGFGALKKSGADAPVDASEAQAPLLLRLKTECCRLSESLHSPGWIWLCRTGQNHELRLLFSRDNDIPDLQLYHPILSLDVWEHAYWQSYPNDRTRYLCALFDCIDPARITRAQEVFDQKDA